LQSEFTTIKDKLDEVNVTSRRILSQVDKTYTDLLQILINEAKAGSRLFSFFPVDRSNFNPKEWIRAKFRLVKSSPYLKLLTGRLGMVLPVASSSVKLALDETAYKLIEEQLDFGKSVIDATIGETAKVGDFLGTADSTNLEHGVATRADGYMIINWGYLEEIYPCNLLETERQLGFVLVKLNK
jgi:hypothetical protein